jgi:sugar phosphate isomerase/epimerase
MGIRVQRHFTLAAAGGDADTRFLGGIMNRRDFARGALGAFAALAGRRGNAGARVAVPSYPIRLGAPIAGRSADPEELASAHAELGYAAAYCPRVTLKEPERISAIASAFRRRGIVIAEVGRWVNLLDANPEIRKANLERVIEGLALAEEIGALCCVDIAGSFSTERWEGPHPDNLSERFFDAAVENARKVIDAVKPRRAKFCYEMMPWSLPDSPDTSVRMLKAIARDAYGIHLDPCNLVNNAERMYGNARLLHECFDKLGAWIVSCHAKDVAWGPGMNVHIREVRPGTGVLDYRTYLSRLAQIPRQPPLMLEHLSTAEEYDKARLYSQGLLPK